MTDLPPEAVRIFHHDDQVIVQVPENLLFPQFARLHGAIHDPAANVWRFPPASEPALRQHCMRLFGTTSAHSSWHTIRLEARGGKWFELPLHIMGRPLVLPAEAGTLKPGPRCELHAPPGHGEPGSWKPSAHTGTIARLHPYTTVTVHSFPANLLNTAYGHVMSPTCAFRSIHVSAAHRTRATDPDPLLGAPATAGEPPAPWQQAARHLYDLLQTGAPSGTDPRPGEPFQTWQGRYFRDHIAQPQRN